MKVNCTKESIHSFLKCKVDELENGVVAGCSWSLKKIDKIRRKMGKFDVLIIEEISTTRASLFVALDVILRLVFNETTPFGGKTVTNPFSFISLSACMHNVLTAEPLVNHPYSAPSLLCHS